MDKFPSTGSKVLIISHIRNMWQLYMEHYYGRAKQSMSPPSTKTKQKKKQKKNKQTRKRLHFLAFNDYLQNHSKQSQAEQCWKYID